MASADEYGQPIWWVVALSIAAGLFALVGLISSVCAIYKAVNEPEKSAPRKVPEKIEAKARQLLERIQLEVKVRQCTLLLILCLAYTILFFCAWYMYSPPEELFAAHDRLQYVLGLDQVSEISSANQIYTFAKELGARNAKLQPTNMNYWCEERFFTRTWDPITSQPQVTCSMKTMSSDLASLPANIQGLFGNPGKFVATGADSSGASCADKDIALSNFLGKQTTCVQVVGQAADWCNYDVGIGMCPKECKKCGPYKYTRMQEFEGPTITVLPVVIHQTRFKTKKCVGFARKFEGSTRDNQGHHSSNFFNPPLDGNRASKLTECIDRSRQLNTSYAIQLPCPADVSTAGCTGGLFQDTPRWKNEYPRQSGSVVYPKLLLEPQTDAEKMSTIQWIDGQTGTVVFSMMAYTEGLEVFTRVKVEFEFTDAGGVKAQTRFDSFRFPRYGQRVGLITLTIFVCVICISAIICVYRFTPEVNVYTGFEYLSKLTTMFVTGIIMICGVGTDPRSQYEALVRTMAGAVDPATEPGSTDVLEKFFKVSGYFDDIQEMNDWITIFAYITACVLIAQVMKYLHEHPGSAVFSATTIRAFERLFYLLFLFSPLFLFLAFLAFCLFGYELPTFDTYGDALIAHVRMMYGDFLQPPNVSELNAADTALFWVHALVFMLVTFVVLRFTFLAVIVDAFCDVKKEAPQTARDVLSDVADSIITLMHFQKAEWPDQKSLIEHLEEWLAMDVDDDVNDLVTPEDFSSACKDAPLLQTEEGAKKPSISPEELATKILTYYLKKVPEVGVSEDDESAEGDKPGSKVSPLESARLSAAVVQAVTKRLAEKDPVEADTFVTIGLLSCQIANEFRKCGLIKPDNI